MRILEESELHPVCVFKAPSVWLAVLTFDSEDCALSRLSILARKHRVSFRFWICQLGVLGYWPRAKLELENFDYHLLTSFYSLRGFNILQPPLTRQQTWMLYTNFPPVKGVMEITSLVPSMHSMKLNFDFQDGRIWGL